VICIRALKTNSKATGARQTVVGQSSSKSTRFQWILSMHNFKGQGVLARVLADKPRRGLVTQRMAANVALKFACY